MWLIRLKDDLETVRIESRHIDGFDIFLESDEKISKLLLAHEEYRFSVDLFDRLICDIDIGDSIESFDEDFRWCDTEVWRNKEDIGARKKQKYPDSKERISVFFRVIDDEIRVLKSFLF